MVVGDAEFPREWTVFGPFDGTVPVPNQAELAEVPKRLASLNGAVSARKVKPVRCQGDLSNLLGDVDRRVGRVAYVYLSVRCDSSEPFTLGVGGDYRFRAWLNGVPLFDGKEIEDGRYPPRITSRLVNVEPLKGRNALVIRFVAGAGCATLAVGGPRELRMGDHRSIVTDLHLNERRWRRSRLGAGSKTDSIDIGSRRELFIDDVMVDRLSGGAERRLFHPVPKNVIMTLDKPWEGNVLGCFLPCSVFEVDGRVRLYYKGVETGDVPSHRVPFGSKTTRDNVCLAESDDGIHFARAATKAYSYDGSNDNNIVFRRPSSSHNFTPFLDENPNAPEDQRFKALAYPPGGGGGLTAYVSKDGIRWRPLSKKPLITKGAFDSQNVAFWDPIRGCYVEYHRGQEPARGPRGVMTGRSDDFVNWTEPEPLRYEDDRREHLYINCVRSYFRAPHLYLGTPGRLVPARQKVLSHPNAGVSDAILMVSRDGLLFHRWAEAFIRPSVDDEDWTDRNNFPAWGMIQTSSSELSLYWCERNGHAGVRLRRGALRLDGFVSIHAGGEDVGELLTRPFVFSGDRLEVNYATSANGALMVELCDAGGVPLDGFTFADGEPVYGNEIARTVAWRGTETHLGPLAGKPVRLRVRLLDADLFAFRFPGES